MGQAIEEFGLQPMDTKSLLEWSQNDLNTPNAQVRNAMIQVLGIIHRFVGPSLGDMIRANIKPALMSTIQAEFEKNPQQSGFVPNRTPRNAKTKAGNQAMDGVQSRPTTSPSSTPKSFNSDDLLPRYCRNDAGRFAKFGLCKSMLSKGVGPSFGVL